MEALFGIMTAFGLSASAGLNAYIPLMVVGVIAHYTNWIKLNPPYDILANAWVLIVIGLLLIVEMLADKIPAVNHINDIIQTGDPPGCRSDHLCRQRACAHQCPSGDRHRLRSAGCRSVHVVKSAAIRPVITATTGGTANIPVSIAEDVFATGLSILSIVIPVLVAVILILSAALIIWWFWRRAQRKKLAVS